ncbi:helix-turn-helix domain-containing protein [Prochlorococcus sp. MIT 1307]|uniref:helix-turn-helix domain-containing protein n=1 Tax=Prochlorococcus sp. MIT 1307 TaxID=3096219 RepID=UPI002A761A80|nr:helix-turn-helix domain-containing protein [Prochlorococcus sp. MIT 1307]
MALKIPWMTPKKSKDKPLTIKKSPKQFFLEAAQLLKERREEYGISRNDLARKTRITPYILEAIEKGYVKKLPEAAYLYSMLTVLEIELNLERKSLDGILKLSKIPINGPNSNKISSEKHIFRTLQGVLIYISLMLCSIFGLNYQQRQLAKLNSQTFLPIPSNIERKLIVNDLMKKQKDNTKEAEEKIITMQYYPIWVDILLSKFKKQGHFEWLELEISNPSKVSIKSGGRHQSDFKKVRGKLKLKLLEPVIVNIQPPLTKEDKIIWRGKNYIDFKPRNSSYRFTQESNNPIAPSNDRPDKIPRSP